MKNLDFLNSVSNGAKKFLREELISFIERENKKAEESILETLSIEIYEPSEYENDGY